jgi:site-specific DNA-adenine methylase
VSRISESVSGREAKTETKKQMRKEYYLRMKKETDKDKGDMAANNNYCYLSVTKRTTKLHITNNKWTVPGSAMCLAVGRDGM